MVHDCTVLCKSNLQTESKNFFCFCTLLSFLKILCENLCKDLHLNLHHFARTKSSYSISLNVQHHMKVCNEKYLYAEKFKNLRNWQKFN